MGPGAALTDANRSLSIDSNAVTAYYVRAAALARYDQAAAAQAALRSALTREPRNFVTWALLGDIAVRRRQFALAQRYYLRAHHLNPRNPMLAQLSRDPRASVS